MPNSFLTSYRQDIASLGIKDDRPDWMVMRDDLVPLAHENPDLLHQYPDFAREFSAIREANAPSLAAEAGRAVKAGTQGLFSGLDAAAGLGLRAVGADKAGDYMMERSKALGDLSAENAPTIPTMADVAPGESGLARVLSKDTARYVAAKGGSAVPSLALIAGAGMGTGALAARGAVRAAEEAGLSEAATAAAERAAAIHGGEAGAFIAAEPMSVGGIYSETGRGDLALGLGTLGALAGAAPVIGLPARVVRSLYPELTESAATAAAAKLVGQKASQLLTRIGRAGITEASGVGGMLGMEAANIVAKNITQGKDALALDAQDWNRLREAAVGAAIATVPFAALSAREGAAPAGRKPTEPPPPDNGTTPPFSGTTEPPSGTSVPPTRTAADIYRAVTKMTPDEQRARLAELSAKPQRTKEEDGEIALLQAFAPAEPPAPPPAAAAAAPAETRADWLRRAVKTPGATFKYTVMPGGEGYPTAIQVDVLSPEGHSLASANGPEELRPFGLDLPDVPANLPQGQYTVEQIKAAHQQPGAVEAVPPVAPVQPPPAEPVVPVGVPPPVEAAPLAPPAAPAAEPATPPPPAETFSRAQIVEQRRLVRDLKAKAGEMANAGKAKRAIELQQQANDAQEKLAQMVDAKKTGRKIPIGMGPEGEDDLLTDIAEHVGPLKTIGTGGEVDDIAGALSQGAARLLRGGEKGFNGGDAIEVLNNIGIQPGSMETRGKYNFQSTSELASAIDRAVAARRKFGESFKAQAYKRQIEDAFMENAGRRLDKKAKDGIPIEQIGVGGEFNIRGEKFTVVDVTEDGLHYIVQDGHKFEVPVDALVFPDRDEPVKPGAKPSTDFLSPEDEAAAQAAADAARRAVQPKPGEVAPVVPSTKPPVAPPGSPDEIVQKAAADLQNQPRTFAHGRVIESEPTLDLRSLENVTPEGWEKLLAANMEQGTRGSTGGNRAETRIAVALEGPDGKIVVTGLVKPQKVLTETGFYELNAPALQRMGAKETGKRVVHDGGDSPALVREVAKAGWKPLAVLHFAEKPGKIFERFENRKAFDDAWGATEKRASNKAPDVTEKLPHAKPEAIVARRGQAEIEAEIDRIGGRLQEKLEPEERAALENRVIQLYDELDKIIRDGQSQVGDTDINDVNLRQVARDQLPVHAARAGEFQAVAARLRNMGAKVDVFAKEFFQQGSAQIIQQQIQALQQRAAAAPAGERAAVQRQIAALAGRMTDLDHAQGATFTPWHIAISVEDVQRANLGNFVTLLHEASESLAQRLNPSVRGRVTRAVGETIEELRSQARAAAQATNVPVARETGAIDLLSETLAQKLAAKGVPDAPSLAQAIVRWVKDLYYRVSMAAQRAFGAEPDAQTAIDWFENQLRREVFGDYDYRLSRLLDRYMQEPLAEAVRRYSGRTETPGGVVDFLDPLSGKLRQPWVEPLTGDALNWNVAFRTDGEGPGGEEIPEPEARGRIDAAAINALLDFTTKLHAEIGGEMDWERFWKIIGRGDDPKILIGSRPEGVRDARVGGERMTGTMNGLATLNTRIIAENLHFRAIRELAKAREVITAEGDKLVSLAKEVNKLEGDRRNASLQEETLRAKAKEMVAQLVRDYRRGLDTAHAHGELADAVRTAEGLLESDEIPEQYQKVFKAIHDGDVTIFDYVRALSRLDLPLSDLSVAEITKAIRDNAESSETLKQLAENKPLSVALAVLAKGNADQVDEIQLGWLRDAEQYRIIHDDLQVIRRATPEQLRQLVANTKEQAKHAGLRERIKYRYLQRRRALRTAQDRIDRAEERSGLIAAAAPKIGAWVEELQTSGSTAPSDWYPREGAQWTAMSQREDGTWGRQPMKLRFNPDGSAVDSDQIKRALASNMAWLHANEKKAGGKFYETLKQQTTSLAMLDIQQKYHIGWSSRIDRMTQTLIDEAQKMGRGGEESARQLRQFHLISRSHREEALTNAHWWTRAFIDVGKAAGIEDWGKLHEQLYNPINYFLNTNPGLDEAAAVRQATRMARARLVKDPAPNFDERFGELLRRTKRQSEFMLRVGEQYGSWTKDPRLKSELRRAVAQGWLTTPRSFKGDLVMTVIRDMQKAGWKLALKEQTDSRGQKRESVVRATTFDDLTPEDAGENNTLPLDQVLQKYFTPDIVQRWLVPFVNKGGAEIFKWGGEAIPQADVQSAWDASGRSILRFIDNLSGSVKLEAREDEDPKASFRLSILRQIDRLFGMEARLAYDSSQVRNLFDPMGPKPHLMMDARLNDMLPPEHLEFAWFDPKSSETLLSHVAFHAAFGRNGERMVSSLNDMRSALQQRKQEYQSLKATTKNMRVAEAAARGWDYKELERGAQAADRAAQFQEKVQGLFGFGNPAGPFNDLRSGLEVVHTMAGEIVDNPKVSLYHVLQLFERPFAQRSLGPMTVRATAGAVKDFLKTELGSMLEALNVHILHASEYEKEVGSALGINQRNMPWDVTVADIGQRGRFQQSNADRWIIKPLRMFRYLQQKGIKIGLPGGERDFPRFTPVPGFGVLNTIMQAAAMQNGVRNAKQMELFVKRGIDYFSTHREEAQDPTFRFKPADLRVGRLDTGVYDWFRAKTTEYGMGNLEDIARDAMPRAAKGDRLLTKDQVLRLSQMAANELDGEASIATTPSILATNPVLRVGLPLLRWPIWKMHQVHEGLNTIEGQRNLASVMKGLGALALWNLPVGIAFSFMMDGYDDKLIGKKSVLPAVDATAAIPLVGPAVALTTGDKSIPENLIGFLERSARAGNIYGLAWDMASQFSHPLDQTTGQRQFSLDQRVLVMSQFLNFQQAMRNMAAQDWTVTWSSFWKPFMQSMGGNGVMHAVDITNNLLGLDNAEARTVMRINAGNYLRAAGAEIGMEMHGGGGSTLPTPVSVWTREMLTAAMANDRLGFMEAHQKALEAARKVVGDDPHIPAADREKHAEDRVRQSWRARDPMGVFRYKPSPEQTAALFGAMDERGREDVQQALARYHSFDQMITPSAAERTLARRFDRLWQPPRQRTPASLLFSP